MKRYWLPTLLGILMLLTLTACGNPPAEETPAETAHVHAWGEWVETATPSCTDEGKHERTCAACGETETKLIHPFGHRESAWITDPNRTCLIESAKHTMCITCGEILQTEIIYAEGHRESDWITDKKATCTTDGSRHKVCNTCNQTTVTEIVPALGHTVGDWIEDHAVTCTTDGARHKTCTTCGATTETETLYATGHQNGDWIVDKKPTCTLDGVRHKQCTVCGETNATETLYATGHQVGNWIIDRAATCTTDGTRHKTCTVCGNTTLREDIYAPGHVAGDWIVDRAATCTLSGIRHRACTACGETVEKETLTVSHTEVIDPAKAATCLATGLSEGKHCAVCQTVIVAQETLEKQNHLLNENGICTVCRTDVLTVRKVADGVLVFSETFDHPDNSNHDEVLALIGWTKLTQKDDLVASETNAAFEVLDGRLYFDNYGTGRHGADGYYAIDALSAQSGMVNLDDRKYTLQFELEYAAAAEVSNFATLITEATPDGYRRNEYNLRINGYSDHGYAAEGLFSTYSEGSSLVGKLQGITDRGVETLAGVKLTVRLQWEPEVGQHVYVKTAAMSNFVKVSEPASSMDMRGMSSAVQFRLHGAVEGYLDNIRLWTGWGNTVAAHTHSSETYAYAVTESCYTEEIRESRCADCGWILSREVISQSTAHDLNGESCSKCGYDRNATDIAYLNYELREDGTYEVSAKHVATLPEAVVISSHYNGKLVTAIAPYGFANAKNLEYIGMPEEIVEIGGSAFHSCTSLSGLWIPEHVTRLESWTFYRCTALKEVILSKDLRTIGGSAFFGCESLAEITVPEGVTEIENNAFHLCIKLTDITLPKSLTVIGEDAFVHTALEHVYYPSTEKDWARISIATPNEALNGATMHYLNATAYLEFTLKNNSYYEVKAKDVNNLPEILIIPSEYEGKPVTTIASRAFEGATSLKKVIISEGVTTIRDNIFNNCSNLISLTLPDSLENCSYSFAGIRNDAYTIDEQGGMYLGTASNPYFLLATVQSKSTVTSFVTHTNTEMIQNHAFSGCKYLTDVTISEGVRNIGNMLFMDCDQLQTISFPSTLTAIGSNGVLGTLSKLTSVTVSEANEKYMSVNNCIIEKATKTLVAGCVSSVIPADGSVTKIGNGAFQYVPMTELIIPEGITEIQLMAFRYCDQLTSVVIPSTVKTIREQAFSGCDVLTSLSVAEGNPYLISKSNSIIRISDNTLVASASDVVPEGVKRIQTGTFYTSQIKQITLPLSLTEIEYYTFDFCENLTDVYYAGTEEQWAKVKIGEQNDPLLNAKIHFSSTAP